MQHAVLSERVEENASVYSAVYATGKYDSLVNISWLLYVSV